MTRATVYGINIVIETREPEKVSGILEFEVQDEAFDYRTRSRQYKIIKKHIWNRKKKIKGVTYYEVGLGWASWLITGLSNLLPPGDVEQIRRSVYQDSYRTVPFPGLRDYQNDDVLHILKYRFGLVTVQTGYGKTESIATLANYFATDLGKRVLLVAPGSKARDEIVKRLRDRFGVESSLCLRCTAKTKKAKRAAAESKVTALITSGFVNQGAFRDSEADLAAELSEFEVILADEIEYCINPAGEYIFSKTAQATCRYAFSGTADKGGGNIITFQGGLTNPAVHRNLGLIRFFGPSLVFRKPLDRIVNLVKIQTHTLYDIDLGEIIDDSSNMYLEAMTALLTTDRVATLIARLPGIFPRLFVPINNLESIIETWIEKYWRGRYRVLLVCGEGYRYYGIDQDPIWLDLTQACQYIDSGQVDVIPSTSSGFRALDLPGLSNILLVSGRVAGSVLQQVGRVARSKEMNIITLVPDSHPIPIYSKGLREREAMIKEYYRYCEIREQILPGDSLIGV